MSSFISVEIIILAALILTFLQLTPGVFAIFYHYALGKYSKRKASDLTLFYIIGVEVITALLFLSVFYLVSIFLFDDSAFKSSILRWILAGIFLALAFVSFFFYYRRDKRGSKLFLSRRYVKAIDRSASTTKTRAGAFTLGIFATSCELLLTLPLYIAVSVEALKLLVVGTPSAPFTILFVLSPLIPLFFLRWHFQSGHNLADVAKSRAKNKTLVRLLLTFLYLTLAVLVLCFGGNWI